METSVPSGSHKIIPTPPSRQVEEPSMGSAIRRSQHSTFLYHATPQRLTLQKKTMPKYQTKLDFEVPWELMVIAHLLNCKSHRAMSPDRGGRDNKYLIGLDFVIRFT